MNSKELKYQLENKAPKERKRFIRNLFDSIVPTYDLLNRLLSMGIDTIWRNRVVRRNCTGKGELALDLCCGTGDLSYRMRKKGMEVVSLDFSIPMVEKGVEKGWLNSLVTAGDASVLPYKEDTFRLATIAFGIRNIPDLDNFFKETQRVLGKGGTLVILELTRPTSRLMGFCYDLYLVRILPFVGGLISGRKIAYKYLSETIESFIDPLSLKEMMLTRGFKEVNIIPQTGGIATIIEATV